MLHRVQPDNTVIITVPISSAQISLHLNKDISLTKRRIGFLFLFGDTREASVIVIVIVVPLSLPSL